jgi:antirestriction protein ArdC
MTITTTRKAQAEKFNADQAILDKLVAPLLDPEAPRAVWNQPYTYNGVAGLPLSISTGKPYRGINVFLLAITAMEKGYASPFWGTYKKITELGGQIRKGEKSTMITFWKKLTKDMADEKTGEIKPRSFFMLRVYNVFNVAQADWAEGKGTKYFPEPIAVDVASVRTEAHAIIESYVAREGISFVSADQSMAYYQPSVDLINVPLPANMVSEDAWCLTAFHECGHSTGHTSRLNREGVTSIGAHRGGTIYSFEELVAEMTAALLAGRLGFITDDIVANSVAYCQGWAKYLTSDRILGVSWDEVEEVGV